MMKTAAALLAASMFTAPLAKDVREHLEGDRTWLMSMECSVPKLPGASDAAARAARQEMCDLEAHMKDMLRDGPIVLKQED